MLACLLSASIHFPRRPCSRIMVKLHYWSLPPIRFDREFLGRIMYRRKRNTPFVRLAAREHLSLRLSVAHSAIDHPPLGHLLFVRRLFSCRVLQTPPQINNGLTSAYHPPRIVLLVLYLNPSDWTRTHPVSISVLGPHYSSAWCIPRRYSMSRPVLVVTRPRRQLLHM